MKKKSDKTKPRPKPYDARRLERAALHYLERFTATEARLADILGRKLRRGNDGSPPSDEQQQWVADIIQKCVKLGYVDDRAYAESRFRALRHKGKSRRHIRGSLMEKGVSAALVDDVLKAMDDETGKGERLAAMRLAKRRHIGPSRRVALTDDEDGRKRREKEIAIMARAGFSLELALKVIDAAAPSVIEDDG